MNSIKMLVTMSPMLIMMGLDMAWSLVQTSQTLDLKKIMLEGRQNWRGDVLSFENLCNCQCRKDLQVFDEKSYKYLGNCQTKSQGLFWCYIPDEAVPYCIHAQKGEFANSYWSLDACYTPTKSDEPCTPEWNRKYQSTELIKLKMCAIRQGPFNADDDNLQNVMEVCYMPQEGQPDMGCDRRIETRWGPAVPCGCWNIDQFVAGVTQLNNNRHLNCVDGAGVAFGGRLLDTSATSGLGGVRVENTFKVERRCQWRIVPETGGTWKCVRGN